MRFVIHHTSHVRFLLRYVLLIMVFFLSTNSEYVIGDTRTDLYYCAIQINDKSDTLLKDYRNSDLYLIDFEHYDFEPTLLRLFKGEMLISEEEISDEERVGYYEMDLSSFEPGQYTLFISDNLRHVTTEIILNYK